MATARLDHDGGSRRKRMHLVVELDVTLAFKNVVKFSHSLVKMGLAVPFYFDEMHGSDRVLIIHEGATRLPTRTRRRLDIGEPRDLKILFDHFVFHAILYAPARRMERELFPAMTSTNFMKNSIKNFLVLGILAFLLSSCGDKEEAVTTEEEPTAPVVVTEVSDEPRNLTPEEQGQVVDSLLQARAKQQAAGLGNGKVKVNGVWNYTGYSFLSPDPSAAIEARLVAVDVTISGHTPFLDIDDVEVVDGSSMVSYGSDPHVTPLTMDGSILPESDPLPEAPAASRWLFIYAFPKNTPSLHLYYWGKQLTPTPIEITPSGMELPYPATQSEPEAPE